MYMSRLVCILAYLLLVACIVPTKSGWQVDPDDDYFRLGDSSTQDSKRAAVVNPKKSVLPIGAFSILTFYRPEAPTHRFAYVSLKFTLITRDTDDSPLSPISRPTCSSYALE